MKEGQAGCGVRADCTVPVDELSFRWRSAVRIHRTDFVPSSILGHEVQNWCCGDIVGGLTLDEVGMSLPLFKSLGRAHGVILRPLSFKTPQNLRLWQRVA